MKKTPVETRDGRKVIIHATNRCDKRRPVLGDIICNVHDIYTPCIIWTWTSDGTASSYEKFYDLFFSAEKTTRRMTVGELYQWIGGGAADDHRELFNKDNHQGYDRCNKRFLFMDDPLCPENVLIRTNNGEWREPLIAVEE